MKIKKAIDKVPGGLMVVPLLAGAFLNTIDQLHIPFIMNMLKSLGVSATDAGYYEFFKIGGFSQALFKDGALTLCALFLFCAGSQMNLRVGGAALKKGVILTTSKYAAGVIVGITWGLLSDPVNGFLGLSTLAIIAAMTNGNGGMFAALTGQYGNRSDVGATAVLSLNDGPFFTLMALGMMGANFPLIAFIAVLLPIMLGMLLGNLDGDIREFLSAGESLVIPFFAFALGAGMNLSVFFNPEVLGAGVALALMTVILSGGAMALAFKIFREKSVIAPWAEASTAGNAVATPAAIAAAATVAAGSGLMSTADALVYQNLATVATAQISIAAISTSLLVPVAVILADKYQRRKGIDGRVELAVSKEKKAKNSVPVVEDVQA
ncbi:2-keto-3-deoxygluconate permease [Sporosarcina sp. BP05]|uniref:2-keto-3-deoxygluconate permease n=1 Tax=Sporosarcina sp. BP05 TaxID=2758726 RepID=UPI001644787F|nr:2-keto-3-deoxygluconate permease [Sporosarcina sp. BP05]